MASLYIVAAATVNSSSVRKLRKSDDDECHFQNKTKNPEKNGDKWICLMQTRSNSRLTYSLWKGLELLVSLIRQVSKFLQKGLRL